MKTKIFILLALIILNVKPGTAGNKWFRTTEGPSGSELDVALILLAPSTPKEATFEEETAVSSAPVDLKNLAPVIPVEASFDDTIPVKESGTTVASPTVPKEASFEDENTDLHYFHAPCDVHYGCSM